MKARDNGIRGVYHLRQYLPWQGKWSEADISSWSRREQVGSSGIVRGNRKDPNSFRYFVVERDYLKGSLTIDRKSDGYKGQYNGSFVVYMDTVDPVMTGISDEPAWLYNAALSKLNDKVRGTLDLSVSLAQTGQTARMFNATQKVAQIARLARGNLSSVKAISDAWLEYRYGWSPLLSDIYDAATELTNVALRDIERVKGRASDGIPGAENVDGVSNVATFNGAVRRNGRYVCEIGLSFKTAGHNIDRWSSLNPVSLAWELLPYSFVVDWFIDVGSYIRNLETSLLYGNSFVKGYVSQGTFFDGSFKGYVKNADRNGVASCATKYRYFRRAVLTSYPCPRLPSFKADLGSGRLLNAAALLGALLKR